MLNKIFNFLILLFLISSVSLSAPDQNPEKDSKKEKIKYDAKKYLYDPDKKILKLWDGLRFSYKGSAIKAEKAEVDSVKKVITVEGGVVLNFADGTVIESEKVIFYYETQTAKIFEGRVTQGSSILVASEIEKTGEKSYKLENGYWTACKHCDEDSPDWRIWGLKSSLTIEDYGVIYSPVFYIRDVPVFWFPFVIIPIKRQRQTGFLFPTPSFSENHGWSLLNEFFLALSPHQDMTFSDHFYEKRGHKYGFEYRLAPTQNFNAELNGYFLDDEKYEKKSRHEDRMAALYKQSWIVSESFSNKIRATWMSDDEYPQDFPKEVPMRENSTSESNLLFTWNTQYSSLNTEAVYYGNLLSTNPQSGSNNLTIHKLPEVRLSIPPVFLGTTAPLYFSFDGSYANFQNISGTDFVDKNTDGTFNSNDVLLKSHRFDVFPRLVMPLHIGGKFEFIPEIGYRDTRYRKATSSGWDERTLFRVRANLLTNIERVFHYSGKEHRATRHTIEPRLEYTYIPRIKQTTLPNFDGVDDLEALQHLTYYLSSWLHFKNASYSDETKKEVFSYPEALEFRLFQTVDLKKLKDNEKKYFQDLTSKLKLHFSNFESSMEVIADTNDWFFKNISSALKVTDNHTNTYELGYSFTKSTSENMTFLLGLNAASWIKMYAGTNYSFEDHKFLEHKAGFKVTPPSGCWNFNMDFLKSVDQDLVITAGFNFIFGPEYTVPIVKYSDESGEADYEVLPGG